MTQAAVTPIRPEDAEREAEIEQACAFDRLVSDWMIAHAEARKAETDEDIDALSKRKHELFWKIISTKAPLPRHTDDKFAVMLLDVGDDKLWRGYTAMIESIRSDIDNGWDLDEST